VVEWLFGVEGMGGLTVEWRPATAVDAGLLAELANETSGSDITPDQASVFLQTWQVEIASKKDAAVAVLPPANGRSRGYGAWWVRRGSEAARFGEVADRLVRLAGSTPGLSILQISLPAEETAGVEQLQALRFERAYPLWTMVHDATTWPQRQPELPSPLYYGRWSDVLPDEFQTAYEQAYRDQRVVEPHDAETWNLLTSGDSFARDLATLAMTPDGQVAGFVLGFEPDHGGLDLGPIGTVQSWRGRGISSALLASVLMRCRETQSGPITLTVDGESPTHAQRLYLRHGFRVTENFIAYHVHPGRHRVRSG
jgi:GNAT superfamily N-acetyltransferase